MDKDYKKCLNCKYCYDDDEGLYCELEECEYEFGFKKVFKYIWEIISSFILIYAIMGLLALGISITNDILNVKSIQLGIGFITFAIMYIIYKLIQWWRYK